MKTIPFDIKYRPEIESGKYKVQTNNGKSVRIVCWDRRYSDNKAVKYPIVVLVKDSGNEFMYAFTENGILGSMHLVLIDTQEPELTESKDERNINALIRFLNDDKVSSLITYEAKQQWLDWLEEKKEQKPAEWSEEDEKMRANILNVLTPNLIYSSIKGTSTDTSMYKYDKEIAWLKSLRPQQKQKYTEDTIKTAEDHAYFAGQEKFREKVMRELEAVIDKIKSI